MLLRRLSHHLPRRILERALLEAAEALARPLVEIVPHCRRCERPVHEEYMVSDHVWAQSRVEPDGGVLHLRCLEIRLGRSLTEDDFQPHVPSNGAVLFGFEAGRRLALADADATETRAFS